MKQGDKVTHIPTGEKGIVKRLSQNRKRVFVVFNCGHQWSRYMDYTAESCSLKELKLGWAEEVVPT